jgi:serralysin
LLDGGAGVDTASYATSTKGVTVNLLQSSLNKVQSFGDVYVSIENVTGSSYGDSLTGNDAANVIMGGRGADQLVGRGGSDQLFGGDGDDVLIGGADADILWGGAGRDKFTFRAISESNGAGSDTIMDFVSGVDLVDLRAIDANTKIIGDQAFTFIGAQGFSGVAGELRYANGVISADVDGDGVADLIIGSNAALIATDFLL